MFLALLQQTKHLIPNLTIASIHPHPYRAMLPLANQHGISWPVLRN